jgi:hypothetical protein
MSKKTIFIGIVILSILFFSTLIFADQYYDQYPGNSFVPINKDYSYFKSAMSSYLFNNSTLEAYYVCPVNFNVPDGSVYFIKSIGILYKDNRTSGGISICLYRNNLYPPGAAHQVALWESGYSEASESIQTACQGSRNGYKLVDTKKFTYWLYVYFYVDGAVNPGSELILYQVRIHYGT